MTAPTLPLQRHLDGIAEAADRLVGWALEVGPDATVVTCPGWTVRDLVAPQGMVHRWATAMHALDALSARESRMLAAGDVWFGADTALDGIDELLVGFWQRRTKGPRAGGAPYVAVVAADSGDRWLLEVGTGAVRTRRLGPRDEAPGTAAVLSGPAVDLQLALWNRGGAPHDPAGLLGAWREAGAVT